MGLHTSVHPKELSKKTISMYRFHSAIALAVFMVVGYRIAGWMRPGRICQDKNAVQFFDPDEIRAAYLLTKKRCPAIPPMPGQVPRQIGNVEGFLERKVMASLA